VCYCIMRISINLKEIVGPYGGGNQFKNYLKKFLNGQGHSVVNHLQDDNIDVILMISPLPNQSSGSYSYLDVEYYLLAHPQTKVVHRVNYCNLARNNNNFDFDKYLKRANKCADFTVYNSSWIKDVHEKNGLGWGKSNVIIHNGADETMFNNVNKAVWHAGEKIKIVTHHWSKNLNKGHDIYKHLDELLDLPEYHNKFEFTFIGNLPDGVHYNNVKVLPVKFGKELADELKRHHVYVTAARNEAAGMHYIEAGNCGLPFLYLENSSLPEYCSGWGIGFTETNFEEKLLAMYNEFNQYAERANAYPFTARAMAEKYLKIFENVFANLRKTLSVSSGLVLVAKRIEIFLAKLGWVDFWLSPVVFLKNYVSKFYNQSFYRFLLEKEISNYANLVTGKVLDIGSRNRRYDTVFSDAVEILAVDKNPTPGYNVIVADARNLPFADHVFNTVVSIEVLEYVSAIDTVLQEVRRVLVSGGIFIFSVPFINPVNKDFDLVRYTEFGWKELFEKNNFKLVEVVKIGGRYSAIWDFHFEKIRNINGFRLLKSLAFPFLLVWRYVYSSLDRRSKENRYPMGYLFVVKNSKI